MSYVRDIWFTLAGSRTWFMTGLVGIFFFSLGGALVMKEWLFLIFPFVLLLFAWGIKDFRILYLLVWMTIPFAVEVDLPGGFSTDFPSEPLMWVTCLLLPVYLYVNRGQTDFRFIFNPLFVILFIHLSWIILTTVTSMEPVMSIKYTLAKSWYLVCFIVIPILLFNTTKDFKQWGLFLFIPLLITVIVIMIRHSRYGFDFEFINNAVVPIYRNHVDYACALGILLPFAWWMRKQYDGFGAKAFWTGAIGLMILGIYFSFTRAAWLCVPIAVVSYFLIKWKLMRALFPFALAIMILVIGWMAYDNRYISFSPDYEKAVTHKSFDDLLSATTKMEDISTVERFYRWVAGYYMVKEKPVFGFGPATFYTHYHSYVDRHFTTYVSDNPEHSGIHNYYLMTALEQGIPGLVIFIVLVAMVLIIGEGLYNRLPQGADKDLLMAALLSFVCNMFILTLNDTVETDKLGTFFFLSIAIVIIMQKKGNENRGIGE